MLDVSGAVKAVFGFLKVHDENLDKRLAAKTNSRLSKAVQHAERYILENEGEAREKRLDKHRKAFFKYNN